jgi:hypothetical protein
MLDQMYCILKLQNNCKRLLHMKLINPLPVSVLNEVHKGFLYLWFWFWNLGWSEVWWPTKRISIRPRKPLILDIRNIGNPSYTHIIICCLGLQFGQKWHTLFVCCIFFFVICQELKISIHFMCLPFFSPERHTNKPFLCTLQIRVRVNYLTATHLQRFNHFLLKFWIPTHCESLTFLGFHQEEIGIFPLSNQPYWKKGHSYNLGFGLNIHTFSFLTCAGGFLGPISMASIEDPCGHPRFHEWSDHQTDYHMSTTKQRSQISTIKESFFLFSFSSMRWVFWQVWEQLSGIH